MPDIGAAIISFMVLCVIVSGVILAAIAYPVYCNGYKAGQIDAINGIIKYQPVEKATVKYKRK